MPGCRGADENLPIAQAHSSCGVGLTALQNLKCRGFLMCIGLLALTRQPTRAKPKNLGNRGKRSTMDLERTGPQAAWQCQPPPWRMFNADYVDPCGKLVMSMFTASDWTTLEAPLPNLTPALTPEAQMIIKALLEDCLVCRVAALEHFSRAASPDHHRGKTLVKTQSECFVQGFIPLCAADWSVGPRWKKREEEEGQPVANAQSFSLLSSHEGTTR